MRFLMTAFLGLSFASSFVTWAVHDEPSYRGRVADSGGAPIPGVDVTCLRHGSITGRTKTGNAGGYVLKRPDAGCDTVTFALQGFRTEEFTNPLRDALDVVMRVGRLDDLPNPRITGDVVTNDGDPARDASVWMLTIGNSDTGGTRTDARGRFSFSADVGDYAVCARLPGDTAGAACQAARVKWLHDTPAPVHLRLPKPGPIR